MQCKASCRVGLLLLFPNMVKCGVAEECLAYPPLTIGMSDSLYLTPLTIGMTDSLY